MDKMVEAVLIGRLGMARKIFREVSTAKVWVATAFVMVAAQTIFDWSVFILWGALFFLGLAYMDLRRTRNYLIKAFGLPRLWGSQAIAERHVIDRAQEQMNVLEKLQRRIDEGSH